MKQKLEIGKFRGFLFSGHELNAQTYFTLRLDSFN
jgi:hypothetical protein